MSLDEFEAIFEQDRAPLFVGFRLRKSAFTYFSSTKPMDSAFDLAAHKVRLEGIFWDGQHAAVHALDAVQSSLNLGKVEAVLPSTILSHHHQVHEVIHRHRPS